MEGGRQDIIFGFILEKHIQNIHKSKRQSNNKCKNFKTQRKKSTSLKKLVVRD